MELNEYQKRAMTTCMATSDNYSYMSANLVGEVGEYMSKVAKGIRHGKFVVKDEQLCFNDADKTPIRNTWGKNEDVAELKKEAGDILWQLSGLCSVMGWCLDDVAQQNLEKLASRKQRGVIDGNGDNR